MNVRAKDRTKSPVEVGLNTVIVTIHGAKLAEQLIPQVITFAQALRPRVILVRVTLTSEDNYRRSGYRLAPNTPH